MLRLSVLLLIALPLAILACVPAPTVLPNGATPGMAMTDAGCRVLRVIDGDTVDMTCPQTGAFRARLTGYDTPESFEPRCAAEAQAARAATARLRALVRQADRQDARLGGWDRYGRRLVRLSLDGREVGATLTAEGLALPYRGGRRIDWCAYLT
jgi:endonuclease YncB( thermonuclease family)